MKKLISSALLSIAVLAAALAGSAEPALAKEAEETFVEVWEPPGCDDGNVLHNWKLCGPPDESGPLGTVVGAGPERRS